jgi:hypothetical protein
MKMKSWAACSAKLRSSDSRPSGRSEKVKSGTFDAVVWPAVASYLGRRRVRFFTLPSDRWPLFPRETTATNWVAARDAHVAAVGRVASPAKGHKTARQWATWAARVRSAVWIPNFICAHRSMKPMQVRVADRGLLATAAMEANAVCDLSAPEPAASKRIPAKGAHRLATDWNPNNPDNTLPTDKLQTITGKMLPPTGWF